MGAFIVTIGVGDPQGQRFIDVDALVDTGATYSQVSREVLEQLGVPVWRSVSSEMADGRIVPAEIGETVIRVEGQEFATRVVFAEEGESSLLGATTLDLALLSVDPVHQRLVRVNAKRY